MKYITKNDLSDRRGAAAGAKAILLQNYRDTKKAAEPTRLARQDERIAVARAREERHATRERKRLEEQERVHAEIAQRQAAAHILATAEAEAREAAENKLILRVIEDETARKALRDQRYADRKARQR